MVTIPKALDRKVKRALLRARYGWVTGFIRENLWPLFGCALVALLGAFPFYWIFASFQDLAGNYRSFRPDVYWPIAGVCFAIPLIFGLGDEFIGGWPRYNDALTALLPNCGDEYLLHELTLHHSDEKIQRGAVKSIQDQKLLADIARESKDDSLRLAADIKLGHTDKLLTQLKEACRQGNESRIDQLLKYARLLPRQDEKERIIEVLRAEGLFDLLKIVCPNCGKPVETRLDDGFYSGYYDGYNHSNPDPSSWIYRTFCTNCGFVEPQEKYYEEDQIREMLMG